MGKETLSDSEIKILEKLNEAPLGLSFTDIKGKINFSDPTVSSGLKTLVEAGLIHFEYPRKYKITTRGQSELKKYKGIENVENSGSFYRKDMTMILMPQLASTTIRSRSFPFAEQGVKPAQIQVPIGLYLSLGEQRQDIADDVLKELEKTNSLGWVPNFFDSLGKILYKKQGGKTDPDAYKEWLKEVRTQLDSYAVLMVVFEGREAAEKTKKSWEKALKNADIMRKRSENQLKQMQELMKQEDVQRALLEIVVMHCLNLNPKLVASTQTDLESDLIKRTLAIAQSEVYGDYFYQKPSIEQIKEILRDFKKECLAETVTKYVYAIDTEKLEQRIDDNVTLLSDKTKLVPKKGTSSL